MDLLDSLAWNLLKREDYQILITKRDSTGYEYTALADLLLVVRSPILMIGISSRVSKSSWKTGGWASAKLPIVPSTTTTFTAFVEAGNQRLLLHQLNLVRFPYLGISPYICQIQFPYWLEQAYIEVWQYGEESDGTLEPPYIDLRTITQGIENQANRTFELEIEP